MNYPIEHPRYLEARIASFWRRVDKSGGPQACWPWTGSRWKAGYGHLRYDGKTWGAHRFALFLATGSDPGKAHALHSCDNPPCCNPDHIRAGTSYDNMHDAIRRGRLTWRGDKSGEHNGRAKLTAEIVSQIRAEYAAGGIHQRDLARRYGLGQTQLSRIIRREHWDHVP